MTSAPKYGRLERLRSSGRWASTKRFYSRQLERGKLRYKQTRGSPSQDSFRFTASVPGTTERKKDAKKDEYNFDIKIISNTIRGRRANAVKLINVRETVITDTHLMYQTLPHATPDAAFIYTIVEPPKFGQLLLSSIGQDLSSRSGSVFKPVLLQADSRFSQLDLLAGHLKYKLTDRYSKPIDDAFTFRVATTEQTSSVETFRIHHVPGDMDVDITLERLEVEEGSKRTISSKYLFVKATDIRHFLFNVTKTPRHGQIDVLSTNKVDVERGNASFFTSDEILSDRVIYKHDDSESRRDTFHFIATAASHARSSRHEGFQYVAVFHIAVVLRNDQTPTRVVDKVFQVVEGGQKLLTDQDLLFVDLDIDTRPEDIRYNHHAIPNGELVRVDNPSSPVFQFTQADLNNKQILFRHLGVSFGRIMLWVSDGQYFVSTDLRVRASPPFVHVVNNSGLIVQHGDSGFLSTANLSVDTNLNAYGEDIVYQISKEPAADGQVYPKFGQILKDDVPVDSFTEADLQAECIEYRHNGSSRVSKDHIYFTVSVTESGQRKRHRAKSEGSVTLHIYPESYWEPLVIVSNNSLLVDESTSIAITEYDLQVAAQVDMAPRDIIYMIQEPPTYGYLEIDPPLSHGDSAYGQDQGGVTLFDQSVINEGRLHYIQSISNQTSDAFTFDVTNGISQLSGLVFHFTILPKTLYVETREVVVTEGGEVTLTPHHLRVITDYYIDKIEDYLIVDPPTSGVLVTINSNPEDSERHSVTIFSVNDLMERRIRVRPKITYYATTTITTILFPIKTPKTSSFSFHVMPPFV